MAINQEILFEVDLANQRKSIKRGAVVLICMGVLGIILSLVLADFPGKIILSVFIAIFMAAVISRLFPVTKWRQNPGYYRICLDSIGLHVTSGEPGAGKSFSIASSNIFSLVRKQVTEDGYEYWIEEASGQRHQISLLVPDLDARQIFEQIANQYPAIKVIHERSW